MNKLITILLLAIVAITTATARTGVIVWDTINLREGPGTKFRRLGNFEKGKYFAIYGQEGNWFKVNANGIHGYFYKDGVKEVKTLGTYIVREDEVLFRWGPGERYDTLAVRDGGIAIEAIWEHGRYFFGQFNGSGVWFNRDAVVEIIPPVDEPSQLQSPLESDIPIMPEIPEVVVPAVEAPPVKTPQQVVEIVENIPRRERSGSSRWRFGAMLSAKNAWVYSQAVEPDNDIDIPTVAIDPDYTQTMLGTQFRAHLGFSPGRKRQWEIALMPSVSWTPKRHVVNVHDENFEVIDDYLRMGGELGIAFKLHRSFAIAIGGGANLIEHSMLLADGENEQTLLDGEFLAPTGFLEMRYGAGAIKTVAGVGWTQWTSDNTRYFIKRGGIPVPIGTDVDRDSYEVYLGVMLSK